MKSCDENQNLMSTLLPLKIVRVPHIVASKISIRKEEYLACLKHDKSNKSRFNNEIKNMKHLN